MQNENQDPATLASLEQEIEKTRRECDELREQLLIADEFSKRDSLRGAS